MKLLVATTSERAAHALGADARLAANDEAFAEEKEQMQMQAHLVTRTLDGLLVRDGLDAEDTTK